ncbi:MAG: hypothetical protein ABSF83_02020 [Nitrososphaerales archaeon]|jgi:hypothetical protein
MRVVVNRPVGAALVAGEAIGVMAPPLRVTLKPGGMPVRLVHWTAVVDVAPVVPSSPLHVGAVENVHPLGATRVRLVIAYAFEVGFVSVKLTVVGPPAISAFGVAERVGRLALPAACAGTASGTRNSIPDSASIASIVPELNLLKYIEDVFIIFRGGRMETLYK